MNEWLISHLDCAASTDDINHPLCSIIYLQSGVKRFPSRNCCSGFHRGVNFEDAEQFILGERGNDAGLVPVRHTAAVIEGYALGRNAEALKLQSACDQVEEAGDTDHPDITANGPSLKPFGEVRGVGDDVHGESLFLPKPGIAIDCAFFCASGTDKIEADPSCPALICRTRPHASR